MKFAVVTYLMDSITSLLIGKFWEKRNQRMFKFLKIHILPDYSHYWTLALFLLEVFAPMFFPTCAFL